MSERGARSIAVLAATGKWLTASRRRYQSRGIRARASSDFRWQQFAAYRNQCNGPAAVVTKTGLPDRIGLAEIVGEVDGIKKRPPWISSVLGRDTEDVIYAVAAPCSHHQHAEPVRLSLVLKLFVEPDFPLPTVGVLFGADTLRSVVEFHEKIEPLSVRSV